MSNKPLSPEQVAELKQKLRVTIDRLVGRANVALRHLGDKRGIPAEVMASALLRVAAASHKLSGAEELLRPKPAKLNTFGMGE